jgi:phosphonopyruvate decarboxylase
MIAANDFIGLLYSKGIEFYAGVPDSLLKDFCFAISNSNLKISHINSCNEGAALGAAIGHHLATGKIPLVYLQNSGIGNLINPLCSLAAPEVYGVPVLMIVGWRGEIDNTGISRHDEPQHIKQGKITLPLFDILGVPYLVVGPSDVDISTDLDSLLKFSASNCCPVAIVVRNGTFENSANDCAIQTPKKLMSREEAVASCAKTLPNTIPIVSTTGMLSRELYEIRSSLGESHDKDFLTVGGMGHASQIAMGISISKPSIKVACLDGDGAALMHMGGLLNSATVNIIHVLINNGAHDSVGGQPTMAADQSMAKIANSCGYTACRTVATQAELLTSLIDAINLQGSSFIEVRCRPGSRKNLGRPLDTPKINKIQYMQYLDRL